jgi:hypothetical protein
MNFFLSVLFSFAVFFFVSSSNAQTTTTEMKEFADASYLQIDQLDVPKGIKRVEDQLRENVIDVILHSKTHIPIFAQKREKGYSKNYKKFYGLNIRILPIVGDEDFYSLQLFYYNWTTNKYDKKLVKKISKYNVLNELRFATYEILLGKQWVQDNKENIEKRNFERIQDVRKVVNDLERVQKKKKKEDEEKKNRLEQDEERKRERSLIKREERIKNRKVQDQDFTNASEESLNKNDSDSLVKDDDIVSEKINEDKKVLTNKKKTKKLPLNQLKNEELRPDKSSESTLIKDPEVGDTPVPKRISLYGYTNYFQENTGAKGIILTTTNLKYLGFGGKFIVEKETTIPSGYRLKIQIAVPVFKEKYKFPIYRNIESDYFASKILGHLKFFAGLDFTPIYFVGLPVEGGGLQVFENDFLWAKLGVGVDERIFNRLLEIRLSYLTTLTSKSNFNDKFSGSKILISSGLQIKDNHGAEIEFSTTKATGSLDINSKKVAFSYTYKFEN